MATNLGVALAPALKAADEVNSPAYYQTLADAAARNVAQKYGLDPEEFAQTFYRLIAQESGWDAGAYNAQSGASGIAQIVPSQHPQVDPWDVNDAIPYAADYLASQIAANNGSYLKGVAAYDYGPGNVGAISYLPDNQFYDALPQETQDYVNSVVQVIRPPQTGGDMSQPQQQTQPPIPDIPPDPGTTPPAPVTPTDTTTGPVPAYDPLARGDKYFPANRYHGAQVATYDDNGHLITIRDIGGPGGANDITQQNLDVSKGHLSVAQGQLALSQHTQAIQQAIDYVKVLQAERQAMLDRAVDENKAQVAGLPYGIGDQTHYMGFGPNDPIVRMGLASAMPLHGTPYDTSAIGTAGASMDPLVQYHLSQLDSVPAAPAALGIRPPMTGTGGSAPPPPRYPVPAGAVAPAAFPHA